MQKKIDVVRAWRDEEYRDSLSAAERAALPASPAGIATVDDYALRSVAGGLLTRSTTDPTCTTFVGSCVKPPAECP